MEIRTFHRALIGMTFAAAFTGAWRPVLFLAEPAAGIARADEKLTGELGKAIRAGDLDAVKGAVERGADINAADERKMPPIGAAALLGKTDIVDYLAGKGADVNRNDGFGFTPLMCAAQRGQAGSARALLKHGADPLLKGSGGSDPILCATPKGPADRLYDEKTAVLKILNEAIAAKPNGKPAVPPTAPAVVPAATPAVAIPPAKVAEQPLEQSTLVTKNADGTLGVGQKDGKPIDGLKLSQHDSEISTPNIAVATDGTIHIAFVEQHKTTFTHAVYHRSSTDGGKSWSEAKNLSEALPNWKSGYCSLLIDGKNRVYVIWRTGVTELSPPSEDPHAGYYCNLVYRVLENGKWSKVVNIHPPASSEKQDIGALQSFTAVDGAGKAQVFWNVNPDHLHPEVMAGTTYKQHIAGIYPGLLLQATLDGASAGTPREAYMAPVTIDPKSPEYGKSCDGFGVMTGYADAAGKPHFLANVNSYNVKTDHPIFKLYEDGKGVTGIETPGQGFETWQFPPALLVDAKGRHHVISLFPAGEHPHVRDTLLGSDDEPQVIRAATGIKGKLNGMEAYQGPGGRMVVIMQMSDSGDIGEGDNFVSISTGTTWSAPVNITNNAARKSFASRQTGARSNVAIAKTYHPGTASAAFDREGHLLLLMINNEFSIFGSSAFGVELSGGSISTPTLQFLKF